MAREKSLAQNFIFNSIKTLNSTLFPIITFAYSARILGADGVGRVNFAKSIITYFTMIAMLGMNYYGTREAAKLRDDREKLSQFCIEMLIINGCTTLLAYALLAVTIAFMPQLRGYGALLLVCSAAIALQGMGMEWLYQAMEEYRYIAVRSVLFQIGALIAMFLFVREANDVIPYAVITLIASSGSYILNFINARKYIHFSRHAQVRIRRHLKPLLWLFAMAVSIELYTVLDSTMLGFLQGDAAVGRYTAAVKINKIVIAVITAISFVLIPRLSYYVGQNNQEKIAELTRKAYHTIFMLSIPAAIGLFMLSDDIILLFSGSKFAAAGMTMRILTPIVLFIPFSTATNQQTFIPMGKEKLILISTMVGAVTNLICNSLLIPRFAENGAAIATVIAECAVAIVCFYNAKRYFNMRIIFREYYQYWIAALPIVLISLLLQRFPIHYVLRILIVIPLSICCYIFNLIIENKLLGNTYIAGIINEGKNGIKRRFR